MVIPSIAGPCNIIVPVPEKGSMETSIRLQEPLDGPLSFPHRAKMKATGDERFTDSGYASVVTTPEKGTPESSVSGFPRTDANYTLPPKLLRKPTKLTPFAGEISKITRERFDDLAILFGEPLYKCVSKGKVKPGPISMKCMVLGESESTAKPWIVILCDSSTLKRVKKFFDQTWVKQECHPNDSSQPQFDYIIHNRPPRPTGGNSVDVFGTLSGQPHAHITSCGRLLQIGSGDDVRLATLGGILKLQFDYGVRLLGLTAGHTLLDERDDRSPDSSSDEDEDDDDDDLSVAQGDVDDTSANEIYELDLENQAGHMSGANIGSGPSAEDLDAALSAVHIDTDQVWHKVAHLYARSSKPVASGANLDWALLELDDRCLVKPNLLVHNELVLGKTRTDTLDLKEMMIPSSTWGLNQEVSLVSGTHSTRHGHISQCLSYIMLAGGKKFVQTYSLFLSDGLGVFPGDSGSWVVGKVSQEVYGHVVASDIFKEAYVVPQYATFEDIAQQTGAQRVLLPKKTEIEKLSATYSYSLAQLQRMEDSVTASPFSEPQVSTSVTPQPPLTHPSPQKFSTATSNLVSLSPSAVEVHKPTQLVETRPSNTQYYMANSNISSIGDMKPPANEFATSTTGLPPSPEVPNPQGSSVSSRLDPRTKRRASNTDLMEPSITKTAGWMAPDASPGLRQQGQSDGPLAFWKQNSTRDLLFTPVFSPFTPNPHIPPPNNFESPEPTCQKCASSTTPFWRGDGTGSVFCITCGFPQELVGYPPPMSPETDADILPGHQNYPIEYQSYPQIESYPSSAAFPVEHQPFSNMPPHPDSLFPITDPFLPLPTRYRDFSFPEPYSEFPAYASSTFLEPHSELPAAYTSSTSFGSPTKLHDTPMVATESKESTDSGYCSLTTSPNYDDIWDELLENH